MINNIKVLNTDTLLLEVPMGLSYVISSIFLCNTSTTTIEYVDVYCVRSGQSPSDTNTILKSIEIQQTDTFVVNIEKVVLSEGDKIFVKGLNGNLVSATITYIDY